MKRVFNGFRSFPRLQCEGNAKTSLYSRDTQTLTLGKWLERGCEVPNPLVNHVRPAYLALASSKKSSDLVVPGEVSFYSNGDNDSDLGVETADVVKSKT